MSLPVPQLDNLDFDALTELARGLIPRFAPGWTDHNLHDPGMTLLDLLCWLVDQQVYEVGFVSDRHILAFGALLGVYPRPAQPSQGLIWPLEFEPSTMAPMSVNYELAAGAKVTSAEVPDLDFELQCALFVSAARLQPKRPPGAGQVLYASHQQRKEPVVIDPDGDPLVLAFDRPLVMSNDNPAAPLSLGVELDTAAIEASKPPELIGSLTLEYRIDAPGQTWQRLAIVADETMALNTDGLILFNAPPASAGTPDDTPSQLRVLIDQRVNPLAPRLRSIALNVLPVVQIGRVEGAPFDATSTGQPDQAFELDGSGLLDESDIRIKVDVDRWRHVQSLAGSGPADKHFEFRREDRQIAFGNGVNGAIPPVGAQVIYDTFRVTAGTSGNVAAGFKWSVVGTALPAGQTHYGTNRQSFSDGANADDIDSLKPEIRKRALRRLAATTNGQLADAAEHLDLLAVDRAEVLDRYDPALPCARVPGSRTLVVVPKRDQETDATADVPDRYVAAVRQALADRRVLGERLTVVSPERVIIKVKATLVIADGADADAILNEAKSRLGGRLADVQQVEGVEPWPTGLPVTLTEIRTVLARSAGVIAVSECELAKNNGAFSAQDITLSRVAIAIAGRHQLKVFALAERGIAL